MRVLFFALLLCSCSVGASGAVLRVERDGSGDFAVIQDAVDAAATGDTILIGPGRFDEGTIVTVPGWSEYVRILVPQEELTLIGSGKTETIIGPDSPWDLSQGRNKGIDAGPWWGNLVLRVEGIGFENMGDAIRANPAPRLIIKGCRFSGNHYSLYLSNGNEIEVENCEFDRMPRNGKLIFSHYNESLSVLNSSFVLDQNPFWLQQAFKFQGTLRGVVDGCTFVGGTGGVGLSGGSDVLVSSCQFTGQVLLGFVADSGSRFEVDGCTFMNQGSAFFLSGIAGATIRNTVISGISESAFKFDSVGELTVNNCVIGHGPQYAVWQYFPCEKGTGDLPRIDMTNNDWGTASRDSIESWISACSYEVDYDPYIGMPVSTETTSWGSLKSVYR